MNKEKIRNCVAIIENFAFCALNFALFAIPIIYSVTLSILVINVSIPYFFVLSIAISMMIVRSALPAIFSNHNNGLKNVKASSVKNIKQ